MKIDKHVEGGLAVLCVAVPLAILLLYLGVLGWAADIARRAASNVAERPWPFVAGLAILAALWAWRRWRAG